MELREAEALRVFDQHHVCIRHVHADLDHRCRDERLRRAAAECRHHRVLFLWRHATVQQRAFHRREQFAPFRKFRRRSLRLQPFALLDERIDDVSLPPLVELRADEFHRVRQFLRRAHERDDASAPRRHLIKRGHIEVPVKRHRERARDRRCRHHEHIRHRALAAQASPLHHAELVLLINHRQPQPRNPRALIKQRMSADENVRLRIRTLGLRREQRHLARVLLSRAGAQRDADAERLQQAAEIQEVLLSENLRRRHERGLEARLHAQQHRAHRHERLAGADIAVQQAIHRTRAGEIVADLRDGPLLRTRERERQRRVQTPHDFTRSAVRFAALGFQLRALRTHRELHREKFLQHEMLPRLCEILPRLWKVHLPQRPRARHPVERGRHELRDHIILQPLQHIPHDPPQDARREPLGRCVDGHDALEMDALLRVVLHDFKLRMRDHHVACAQLRLAVHHERVALRDHLFHPM